MHPRNRHQGSYDLVKLAQTKPALKSYIQKNQYGNDSIDFANSQAVKTLNQAILEKDYGIKEWNFPDEFLCPPIPGRADLIHAVADLIGLKKGSNVNILDIGTGASLIYPLLGAVEYGWSFVGTDINPQALKSAETIARANPSLSIQLRLQSDPQSQFKNILEKEDSFLASICNPPFHPSAEEASLGSNRKWKNLGKTHLTGKLNFSGGAQELWCEGGEKSFISQMIRESVQVKNHIQWFTSLVSKSEHLSFLEKKCKEVQAKKIEVISMDQGQKQSRILAWSF